MSTVNTSAKTTSSSKTTNWLMTALVVSLVATVGIFWYVGKFAAYDSEYIGYAAEQEVLSQRIAKHALEVSNGVAASFDPLNRYRNRFDEILGYERDGNASTGLPASPSAVVDELTSLGKSWDKFRANVDFVLTGRETVATVNKIGGTVNDIMPKLQAYDEEVLESLIQGNASRDKVRAAARQLMLSQRIVNNMNRALNGDGVELAAERFSQDVKEYGSVLEGMMQGNDLVQKIGSSDIQDKLSQTSVLFKTVSDNIDELLGLSGTLLKIQAASQQVAEQSDELLAGANRLQQVYAALATHRAASPMWGYASGGLALFFLVLLSVQVYRETNRRREEVESENKVNQEAILRLLDEMANLADGDLTAYATVTEDFTGAIADSVNFTIDALRDMVATINATSSQVSDAARQTQETARHLTEASAHQTEEITSATTSINEMVVSIDQVAKDAEQTASMAKQSVDIARKGGNTVARSIEGMDRIRETIQETSKRIKRLGESSQEIGDIVGLINDIAEQTNILALNAAIQAAMAGEAGRGFAVVADEVQRLAERSSSATKQIEALVKTIQTDTNEAVISMEQSTAGVVNGARLSEDAGEALEEIMTVSESLAGRIQDISALAKQQSNAAANVSETMRVIQEITTQTSEGTNETAASIGNLAGLADEMGHSVAGFKLPE